MLRERETEAEQASDRTSDLCAHKDFRGDVVLVGSSLFSTDLSQTGFYTPPPLEGKIATDTLTPLPAPVVYKFLGPWEADFYTPLALRLNILQ